MLSVRQEWTSTIDKSTVLTARLVKRFLAFIFAAAYTFMVQGRVGGITNLSLGELRTIVASNCNEPSYTRNFKTSSTYGYQAIPLPPWLIQELAFWLSFIRGKIIDALPEPLQSELQLETSPAFIKFDTGAAVSGSELVSYFYRANGYNITR
jgi:hypothetical protein